MIKLFKKFKSFFYSNGGSIPQGVNISGPVVPSFSSDIYPTHLDIWGKGSLRTVTDHGYRDAISSERRSIGMLVYTENDNKYWELAPDLTTWTQYGSYACKTIVLSTITEGTDVLPLFTTPSINPVILTGIKVNCREEDQPSITDLIIDILVDGTSIWEGYPENRLTLPADSNSTFTNTFSNNIFTNGIVTFNIIQASGSNVTVEMEFLI